MKKTVFSSLSISGFYALITAAPVHAVCPLCTLAVGAGVGLSKKLGIDDSITGIWLGGLIASSIAWTITFLTRHEIIFMGRKPLVAGIYLALFLWPLYHFNYIGIPGNTFFGYDKLLVGIIAGIATFTVGTVWYLYQKKQNNGRTYFPFQKIVLSVGLLLFISIIFYIITR